MKQWVILFLILFWLGWQLARPVDFIRADLGRHIKNGELILHGHWEVLYKNYYSYTNPEYPFINHHWLFGVFCFVLWHYLGFTGLSVVYLMIELGTFYLFFRCWQRYSSFLLAGAIALLSFPFLTFRSEVRPEGMSYLLGGIFWWLIDSYQQKRLKPNHLMVVLCVLQIIWVNTHVFFLMGPVITAFFWGQARISGEKEQSDYLLKLFFTLLGMCLINPSGINGFMEPFHVNTAYAYPVIEDQSVFHLLNVRPMQGRSLLLYFLAAVSVLNVGVIVLMKREGFRKYICVGFLILILSLMAMKASRMIALFGFLGLPLSIYVFSRWLDPLGIKLKKVIGIILLVVGVVVSMQVNFDWKRHPALGIIPASNEAAEFFKHEKIAGPIFNNYDVGGYLIFHLSPQHQLFVDDRVEAYPDAFFKRIYIPMQERDDIWQKLNQQYHFNVIFYSIDTTPWAFTFMKDRFVDPSWAVVYYSDKAIILLKRNELNEPIIKRDEIKVYLV